MFRQYFASIPSFRGLQGKGTHAKEPVENGQCPALEALEQEWNFANSSRQPPSGSRRDSLAGEERIVRFRRIRTAKPDFGIGCLRIWPCSTGQTSSRPT